ncbi:hypothetical protein O3G_MSEX015228 [Manduca sexta]|uniref:Ig-like domain-containing protein n=1 Tax=Manduca sexta TaxID=7130 RepID=A0A922D144_MANSE|nr:hypothetical protein O3G_MSEX015228 [Manduca sexta]
MSAWPGGVLDRAADTASYTCRSSRNLAGPPVNSTTQFAVEYEPENITVTPKVVSVVENEIPARVVCSAKGFPKPSYSWRRVSASKSRAKAGGGVLSASSALHLPAAARALAGLYACEAYNRHGAVNTTVLLDVMYAPECGIKQTEIDGHQVLVCSAHANPAEVSFTWKLKNDNDSLTDESIWQSGAQSFLRLSAAVDAHRTYLCFANNSVGVSRACERDVVGTKVWWRDPQKLILLGCAALAVLLVAVVLCIIIICICRRMRAKSKCEYSRAPLTLTLLYCATIAAHCVAQLVAEHVSRLHLLSVVFDYVEHSMLRVICCLSCYCACELTEYFISFPGAARRLTHAIY